jgi:four helix bundle protein
MAEVIRSYQDLQVWQRGIGLAKLVYALTRRIPAEERFGLTAQIHRAVVSVPSNIAEGQARQSTAEFTQFLSHAAGSLAEVDTQLRLAAELNFCRKQDVADPLREVQEIRMMLAALRRKLQDKATKRKVADRP